MITCTHVYNLTGYDSSFVIFLRTDSSRENMRACGGSGGGNIRSILREAHDEVFNLYNFYNKIVKRSKSRFWAK